MIAFLVAMTIGLKMPFAPVEDRVDVIEVNVLHKSTGEAHFAQLIFWEWNEKLHQYVVVQWITMPDSCVDGVFVGGPLYPERINGDWAARFNDRSGVRRVVRSSRFRQMHSIEDREYENISVFPRESRRPLRQPVERGLFRESDPVIEQGYSNSSGM